MKSPYIPLTRDLVMVGGGHTHALVMLYWARNPLPGVRITLVNPKSTAPYTGMLPGFVAGHYERHELDIDIARLAIQANARHVIGSVNHIDTGAGLVHVSGRPPIEYDILSINVGAHSAMPEIPGAIQYGHPAKPLDSFASAWGSYIEEVRNGRPADVAVVGTGVAGVELALAMNYRLKKLAGMPVSVCMFEREQAPMNELDFLTRRKLLRILAGSGVQLHCGVGIASLERNRMILSDGNSYNAEFIALAAGARPHPWLADSGLADDRGYIPTDRCLRAVGHENVFATGDCATFTPRPLPRAGVYAVRQAPVLHDNLRSTLQNRSPGSFRPQVNFLKLISTGSRSAVGNKYGLTFSGRMVWKLKDRIDRRFMNRFTGMPSMNSDAIPPADVAGDVADIMGSYPALCRGCGGKVGHKVLQASLGPEDAAFQHADFDDAAEIQIGGTGMVVSTDHLNSFIDDHWMFARIVAVHAASDIWAKGATPVSALMTIVLPRMAERLQRRTIAEIMSSARSVLNAENVDIVGGHTCQGAEMSIGMTVIGKPGDRIITQSGAQEGDIVLMTKPIGTGVILAGMMTGQTKGEELRLSLESMQQTSAPISRLLASHATAMTDITGFGLGGHLLEMLEASAVAAMLDLSSIPLLPGAMRLAEEGVRSSLWEANSGMPQFSAEPANPRADLLFDPQTSGGLLATIPVRHVDETLDGADKLGIPIWQIGSIVNGQPELILD